MRLLVCGRHQAAAAPPSTQLTGGGGGGAAEFSALGWPSNNARAVQGETSQSRGALSLSLLSLCVAAVWLPPRRQLAKSRWEPPK